MKGEADMRFSDEMLYQLRTDFDEYRADFSQYKERFAKHESDEIEKFDHIIHAQGVNTTAIGTLTEQVSQLVKETRDIIQLHRDFQATARVGHKVNRFLIWLAKFGAFGVFLVTVILWTIEHLGKH